MARGSAKPLQRAPGRDQSAGRLPRSAPSYDRNCRKLHRIPHRFFGHGPKCPQNPRLFVPLSGSFVSPHGIAIYGKARKDRAFLLRVASGFRFAASRFCAVLCAFLCALIGLGRSREMLIGSLQVVPGRHGLRVAHPGANHVDSIIFGRLSFSRAAKILEQLAPGKSARYA